MVKFIFAALLGFHLFALAPYAFAQTTPSPRRATPTVSPSPSPTSTPSPTPVPEPRADLTEKTPEVVEPLKKLLDEQALGPVWPFNPIKYAIRGSVDAGVPVNTIVLLLLLPGVAALIAAFRHIIGVRGFGLLIPAALSIVFLAIGPVVGISLFLAIVLITTVSRYVLKKTKARLQYLPRMAMLMLFVTLGILMILFTAPLIRYRDLINVSIFPVLFLVILAEDFTRVQLGKSIRVAINISFETLVLAIICYFILTFKSLHEFVLLNPEGYLVGLMVFDYLLGRYVGLRLLEYYRFRKLISS